MAGLNRRDFLKALGLTGSTTLLGCSPESGRRLIPYIIPPEDLVPGEATWYATTCRECPAGCGLLAKNRDGHIIKVEGNPRHPINQGKLCARGQACLQGLYNPDRLKGPLKKATHGTWETLSWEEGERLLMEKIAQVLSKGKRDRVVFLSDLVTGTLRDLIVLWVSQLGSHGHVQYEPFAYESLRKGNEFVFGVEGIPTYHLDRSDFLISFGADLLETWLSNVEYSRRFAAFRASPEGHRPGFVYVGPRLSLTGANADHWIAVPPGNEFLIALGMLRILAEENLVPPLAADQKALLMATTSEWPVDQIVGQTGVKVDTLRALARAFAQAKRPLALAGLGAAETAIAANLLCTILPGSQELIDFQRLSGLGEAATAGQMKGLSEKMERGEIDLLLLYNTNPVFSLPAAFDFRKNLKSVPFVVSFSSAPDETSQEAHLCLPTHAPLESWGDYAPRQEVHSLMQPVMGAVFNTRPLGDILLSSGRKFGDPRMFPWQDFYQMLRHTWEIKGRRQAPSLSPDAFWEETVRRGGRWSEGEVKRETRKPPVKVGRFPIPGPPRLAEKKKAVHLVVYPTVQLFDGRGASRPWLQELPDPLTQVTWEGWLEIHPDTAKQAGIGRGDLLQIKTQHGTLEGRAFPYPGIHRDTLAMPIGRGHTTYGRFAVDQQGNPFQILSSQLEPVSGGRVWSVSGVEITNLKKTERLAHTDGSWSQHGRELARSVSFDQYQRAQSAAAKPSLRLPLPEGYDPKVDAYASHPHPDTRWIMVVNLDRCIGCGACVVACQAENNVAFVGKEQVLMGREMFWLRIERYFENQEPSVRFLPMLCQHCDSAPCESVCPMYAPHHSEEGLNNQVYNRCIGTFFCSQNCPYKVRRFNWFTYAHPEPLPWQLNPDVTVRQKGVMEKCSFCVQRIVEAKNRARSEGRQVKDGDVTPACAQTCPTDALTFGNLRDRRSRVSRLIQDPRAYQVLDHLNTKPGVIYLKKLTQRLEGI